MTLKCKIELYQLIINVHIQHHVLSRTISPHLIVIYIRINTQKLGVETRLLSIKYFALSIKNGLPTYMHFIKLNTWQSEFRLVTWL